MRRQLIAGITESSIHIVGVAVLALTATASISECADTVEFSFANGLEDQAALRPFGPDALKVAKGDGTGLVISLSPDRVNLGAVGGELKFQLRGDFEITLKYALLGVASPVSGNGCGVGLLLRFDDEKKTGVYITRLRKPNGEVFGASKITVGADGKDTYDTLNVPAQSTWGALRLKREKKRVCFLVADGSGDFQEIHSLDAGTHDVKSTRFQCTTGSQRGGVRARFLNLTVKADELPNESTTMKSGSSWTWRRRLLVIGAALIGFLAMRAIWRRRSRRNGAATIAAVK